MVWSLVMICNQCCLSLVRILLFVQTAHHFPSQLFFRFDPDCLTGEGVINPLEFASSILLAAAAMDGMFSYSAKYQKLVMVVLGFVCFAYDT